jgi:hypothetical protein
MKPYLLFILFSFSGCANFIISKNDSPIQISLSQVEHLTMGKSTKNDLIQLFGKPSVVLYPKSFEAWAYEGSTGQRATFTMDSKGVVLSALWIPISGKECSTKTCVLSHFKNITFQFEKKSERLGKHEVGYYVSYTNKESGVSVDLPMKSEEVSYIVFDLPLKARSPATAAPEKKI